MIELPPSYWFSRSTTREEVDVAIVGAGIVGAATAWWAARAGRRVVVLEGQRVAAGATGRSTGFLVTGGLQPLASLADVVGEERALRLWELSQENLRLLRREILDPAAVDCGWREEGSWRTAPAGTAAEAEWERTAEWLALRGFAVDWREAAEARRASSDVASSGVASSGTASSGEASGRTASAREAPDSAGSRSAALGGALYVAEDGGVDPVALCRGLLALSGAELRTGIAVRGLEPAGDRARLLWAGGELLARAVVLAVDSHVGPLVPAVAGKLRLMGVEALATAPVSPRLNGLWIVQPHGLSIRQLADGTLVAAIAAENEVAGGFLDAPTAAGQARLEATLDELFAGAPHAPVLHRWAGTMVRTADGLPWVRSVPSVPAAAYACGFNGGGLSLAFALGRRLARWLGDRDERHLAVFQAGASVAAPA